jgi:hypothetical protein
MKSSKITRALIKLEDGADKYWSNLWISTNDVAHELKLTGTQDSIMCQRLVAVLPEYFGGKFGTYTNLIEFNRSRYTTKKRVINKIRDAISLSMGEDSING